MTQYIPKSALVAEIRKRLLPVIRDKHYDEWEEGQDSERIAILDIINTIEVKEVDIRSEVSNWWNNNNYHHYKKDYTFEGYPGHYFDNSTIVNLAQYFYELGLKTKGE